MAQAEGSQSKESLVQQKQGVGESNSKPTKEKIFQWLKDLQSVYSARNIQFNEDNKYYELGFRDSLGLPQEYKTDGVVLPTARDIVDAGANHISTVYARFYRPQRGTGKVAEDQAEMLRKFDTAMFYRTKMVAGSSPWRIAAKHGMTHGMWCFEILYDSSRVPEEPERESGESELHFKDRLDTYNGELMDALPIVIKAVHPSCIYQDTSDPPKFIIKMETKNIAQARADWPNWKGYMQNFAGVIQPNSVGISSNIQEITEVTYWDKKWRAIYVNGDPVLDSPDDTGVIEHDYGCIPMVIGYSGLGNADVVRKPEKQAVGLIRYLREILKSESFGYSMITILLKNQAWPITFASGPGAAAMTVIPLKYGKIIEKPQGVTIEEYIKAPPPEFVQQHLEYTNTVLSNSASPNSVRGLAESGVRSGSDRSLVITEATLKFDNVMEQMSFSTAQVMSICTKVMERVVPSDLDIWAKTPDEEIDVKIDKSKIGHHYTTFVEFTPESPEEEARRHADGMNLMKVGAISADTMRRKYLTHLDPIAEEIKVEAERLRANPMVQQALGQIVALTVMEEVQRLQKIQMLRNGLANMQGMGQEQVPQNPLQGSALSGQGMAQSMSQGLRQVMGVGGNQQGQPMITPSNVNQQNMPTRPYAGQVPTQ